MGEEVEVELQGGLLVVLEEVPENVIGLIWFVRFFILILTSPLLGCLATMMASPPAFAQTSPVVWNCLT